MALDERYIPLTLLNEYFVNKDTAEALANGTLEFYRDSSRSTPKTVYQLTTSGGEYVYTALPNPVTLNAAGTAQDAAGNNVAIYAYPYETSPTTNQLELDLYYIIAKDSAGNTQWTREAVPSINSQNDPANDNNGSLNELSNPQFTRYFLEDDSTTLTVSTSNQVFPIAPDWDLVASGSGTITIQRVPVDGNEAIPTYPAYYLSITPNTGVTNPYLRQRLNKNSGLWSGKFLSGFFVAKVSSGSNSAIMKYQDSAGALTDETIFSAALTTNWAAYGGSFELGNSSNTQSGDDAYVDIVVEIVVNNTTDITSIQLLATDSELFGDVQDYDKRSANREQALMGDYYIPRLEKKNIPSLLIGWDFPYNPRQFGESGTVGANTAEYIWDQTILQTTAGLSVDYGTNSKTNGLTLNHQNADKSYALIQYLDNEDAQKFIGDRLSVNINGYTVAAGSSADITAVQVKLFANSANNQFGTLPTSLITLSDDGTITLTGTAAANGWYEITRSNLPVATGELNPLAATGEISEEKDLQFNNWVIEDNTQVTNGVQGIAIVVSFAPAASSTDYETQIDSISVTPGDIPTRPAPVPFSQTLERCQHYYETSFTLSDKTPTKTDDGVVVEPLIHINNGVGDYVVLGRSFDFRWNTLKRDAPNLEFYNVNGAGSPTLGNVTILVQRSGTDITASVGANPTSVVLTNNWTQISNTTKGFYYKTTKTTDPGSTINQFTPGAPTTGYSSTDEALLKFHVIGDARIGI